MFRAVPVLVRAAGLALAAPSAAQSQAVNGAIEGTIVDASGGVLPGVAVTLTNTDTGAARTVVTNDQGLYRAPLLPLGTYRVTAELQGFKKFEQAGVPLAAGQTAVVDIAHAVGDVTEVVTADSPIVDPGKIDLGRNMNEREIQTLPLTSALSVQGDDGRSDPTNLERDRGPNIYGDAPHLRRQHRGDADVRHGQRAAPRPPERQRGRRDDSAQQRPSVYGPQQPRPQPGRHHGERPPARRGPELDVPAGPVQRRPPVLTVHSRARVDEGRGGAGVQEPLQQPPDGWREPDGRDGRGGESDRADSGFGE